MRAVLSTIALALLLVACSKDEELTDSGAAPFTDPTSSVFSVDDVAGTYYGRYSSSSSSQFPPPGWSSYFVDTMFILVRPDSTNPYVSDWIYIGNRTYRLHADSTLSCAGTAQSSSCDGRFYLLNDTLRLECEFHDQMDYSSSSSSFTGFRH